MKAGYLIALVAVAVNSTIVRAGTCPAASAKGKACDAAVTFMAGNSEVVVEPGTKAESVVGFAAEEATNFLSRVLGVDVPIVNEPTPGRASLVLGMNRWSKEVGLEPAKHPRDTFIIRTAGGKVFVAGVDGKANPRRASVMMIRILDR